ncbi:MAG: DUF4369 domain-containing protein [Bacteroidales bacterium]|nr:DUF4369 domain-containing protein [Bacteroidales bacterium]
MKHITILLLILTLFSCKKETQKEFLVSSIAHLDETEIYLWYGAGSNSKVDTIMVRKGTFTVNAAPEEAEALTLFFPKNNRQISFFGKSDSRLKISGDFNAPETLVVEGDSVNNQLTAYRKAIQPEIKSIDNANIKADRAWAKDSLKKYEETLYSPQQMTNRANLYRKTALFISDNKSSYQALLAVRDYLHFTNDTKSLQAWWPQLKGTKLKDFPTFLELKKVYKQLLPLSEKHSLAPFQAYNLENKQEYFYVQSEKKMLILFWSSSDKYSTYLNKKLSAAIPQLAKDTVGYTAISLDDSFDEWHNTAKEFKGRQLIARGGFQNAIIRQIGIGQTPCLLKMGKDAKIAKVYAIGENPLK